MSQTRNPEADDSEPEQEVPPESPCFLKSQVPSANQKTGSWCWAASAQLVVEYLTKEKAPQCTLVDEAFELNLKNKHFNCCQYLDGVPDAAGDVGDICEQGGWPEWILNRKGIAFLKNDRSIGQGLDWAGLTNQICDDRPFIFVVKWSGGGRHSAVGGGYHTTTHFGNFVEVYDHSPDGFYVMPYKEFSGNQGNFTHEFDYVDIQVQ